MIIEQRAIAERNAAELLHKSQQMLSRNQQEIEEFIVEQKESQRMLLSFLKQK